MPGITFKVCRLKDCSSVQDENKSVSGKSITSLASSKSGEFSVRGSQLQDEEKLLKYINI